MAALLADTCLRMAVPLFLLGLRLRAGSERQDLPFHRVFNQSRTDRDKLWVVIPFGLVAGLGGMCCLVRDRAAR